MLPALATLSTPADGPSPDTVRATAVLALQGRKDPTQVGGIALKNLGFKPDGGFTAGFLTFTHMLPI